LAEKERGGIVMNYLVDTFEFEETEDNYKNIAANVKLKVQGNQLFVGQLPSDPTFILKLCVQSNVCFL
jgi:hypothetical protein